MESPKEVLPSKEKVAEQEESNNKFLRNFLICDQDKNQWELLINLSMFHLKYPQRTRNIFKNKK